MPVPSLFGFALAMGAALAGTAGPPPRAERPPVEKIVFGGRDATKADLIGNSVVGVVVPDKDKYDVCTGVLIAPKVVLTAGHCMTGEIKKIFVVFSRVLMHPPKSKRRALAAFAVPGGSEPRMSRTKANQDIALIGLDRPAPSPATPLPVSLIPLEPHAEGVMVGGFGVTRYIHAKGRETGNAGLALRLSAADILDWSDVITLDQRKSGACKGDSGGPVYKVIDGRPVLLGTVMRLQFLTDSKDGCRDVGLASPTANWVTWIDLTMARWGLAPIQTVDPPDAHGPPSVRSFGRIGRRDSTVAVPAARAADGP